MDALDIALAQHAAGAASGVDPLDAALHAHANSTPAAPKPAPPKKADPSYWNVFGNALVKGAAGFADMLPNAAVNAANLGIAGYGTAKGLFGSTDLPELIPSDSLNGWNKIGRAGGLIKDANEPVDTAGRFIDFGGQVAGGGGINPAAIARALVRKSAAPVIKNVAAATASAAGGATGQELTRNVNTGSEAADNAIKAVATLGGGMAGGGFVASRGAASDRAAAALKGVTPQQLALAKELERQARDAGAPLTGYESVQGITGMNPKMQTQQRVAEQSDAAGGGLTTMMQDRPGANQRVFDNAVGSVAPVNPLPDTLAGTLQRASTGAIQTARDQGNARAAPYYAQSSNDPNVRIPSSDWNAIASDPAVAAALEAVKKDPFLGVTNATEGSVQWLDAAKKWLDSRSSALNQAGDRYPAGNASDAASRITGAVDPVVPAYGKARAIVADNMRNNVEPMEASQVGKLSRTDSFQQQADTLLPTKPLDVTPGVVNRTAGAINAQDPNIMRQFIAQYLRGQFAEGNQQNMGGPNVFGGSKFAAQVAGNPMQEQNLVAALTASGASPAQMMEALQIFRAQGMKPGVNSATTANAAEGAALGGGGVGGFIKNPISNTLGLIDRWRNGSAAKDLAHVLSSSDSVAGLEELARVNGAYNPTQQQLLANLLMAGRATSAGSPTSP